MGFREITLRPTICVFPALPQGLHKGSGTLLTHYTNRSFFFSITAAGKVRPQTVQRLGNRLDDQEIVVRVLAGERDLSPLQNVHIGTWAPPDSYSVVNGDLPPDLRGRGVLSPGVKREWSDANYSPPPSAKVKNEWSYASTHIPSWRAQSNFAYLLT